MEKICNKCQLNKPFTEFGKRTAAPDGKDYYCKECVNKAATKRRIEHPEKIWLSRQNRKAKDVEYNKKYREQHKEKQQQYNADYWAANSNRLEARRKEREKQRTDDERYLWHKRRNLKKLGLTKEYFDSLLKNQDFQCANPACLNTFSDNLRSSSLSVDHDHACCPNGSACEKCVRGLLCGRCNQTLGKMHDSIPLLFGLIDYLDDWKNNK